MPVRKFSVEFSRQKYNDEHNMIDTGSSTELKPTFFILLDSIVFPLTQLFTCLRWHRIFQ